MTVCTPKASLDKSPIAIDHLSFSSIRTYQACPRKFAFKYVEKQPEEFTPAYFVFGGSFHKALERIYHASIVGGSCPELDELLNAFDGAWRELIAERPNLRFAKGEDVASLRLLAMRMLSAFREHVLTSSGNNGSQIIAIEESVRFQLLPDVPPIEMRVDLLELRDKQLIVTDWKTSKSRWNDKKVAEALPQLILYARGLTGLWKQSREWVPAFSLVCASNRPGDLTASFRDRLRLEIRLEAYDLNDSTKIVRQALNKLGLKCGLSSAGLIAARGRGVPRKLIGLCENVRDLAIGKGKTSVSSAICQKTFETVGIDLFGLTRQDVEVLRHLAVSTGQPIGIKTLAALIHEDERTLEENIEPYLLSKGLIARTPRGRAITQTGVEHLRDHHGWQANGRSLS